MLKWLSKLVASKKTETLQVNNLGYANDGAMLALRLLEDGSLQIMVDTLGVGGLRPLQKPASVYVIIEREHLPVILEWFSNIRGNVTRVNTSKVSILDASGRSD